MDCEIIGHYFNIFLVEIQLKKSKLEKSFLGARVWAPKPVYWSPKQPEYITEGDGDKLWNMWYPFQQSYNLGIARDHQCRRFHCYFNENLK